MTYKLMVVYDDPGFTTTHGGIPESAIPVIVKAMRKRKVFEIRGNNNSCLIDFSKFSYATYEREEGERNEILGSDQGP